MKLSSKRKLCVSIITLALAPTSALAGLQGELPSSVSGTAEFLAWANSQKQKVVSAIESIGSHPILGFSSADHLALIQKGIPFKQGVSARADRTCQLLNAKYVGAAEYPVVEIKPGPVSALELNDDKINQTSIEFQLTVHKSVEGVKYLKIAQDIKHPVEITKEAYDLAKRQGGTFASHVFEGKGPIPVVVFTRLTCSETESLTGLLYQPSRPNGAAAKLAAQKAIQATPDLPPLNITVPASSVPAATWQPAVPGAPEWNALFQPPVAAAPAASASASADPRVDGIIIGMQSLQAQLTYVSGLLQQGLVQPGQTSSPQASGRKGGKQGRRLRQGNPMADDAEATGNPFGAPAGPAGSAT